MRLTTQKHGAPCWFELATTDQDGAKRFYTALLGWSVADTPTPDGRDYSMFALDGHTVAAAHTLRPELQAQRVPPHWALYFAVDAADASAARSIELGGGVLVPAFDVMHYGRMAVLRDPHGAAFSVWQRRTHPGVGVIHEPNAVGWVELATRDSAAATRYYQALFGWSVRTQPHAAAGTYTIFAVDGHDWGGVLPMNEQWGEMPPHWSIYLRVDDCAAAARRVDELGGKVHCAPFVAPGVGWIAVVADPAGAHFYLIQLDVAAG